MFRLAVTLCCLLFSAGCVVPSLNGLYTPDKAVYEPGLLGQWAEPDSDVKYEFLPADGESYGLVTTNAEGKEARFMCNLVQLGEHTFLDMYPADLDSLYETYSPWHILPVHSFYLVKLAGDELIVKTLNPEWLNELSASQPDAIGVAQWEIGDGDAMPLLTASTDELQAFIGSNVVTPGAFYGEMHLAKSGS